MRSLRILRFLLDLPAKELARAAGLSPRELQRIERGLVVPSPATLAALDAAFVAVVGARLRKEALHG